MKHIIKGEEIPEFVDFLQREKPTSWEDFHRMPGLSRKCREHILKYEQNSLGGYTERCLLGNENLHIDHFRKKGMNRLNDVTFDWSNFIVEDKNANYGACYKDNNTSDIEDYSFLLNPVTDYPEQMMTYLSNGKLVAKSGLSDEGRKKVDFTIDRFNLNHSKLRMMRENIMKVIKNYSSLTDEDIREAMQELGFPTVVDWFLAVRKEVLPTRNNKC